MSATLWQSPTPTLVPSSVPQVKTRFASMFEALGVDPSRLDLVPLLAMTNDHLARRLFACCCSLSLRPPS